tara:strand:+ start:91 stop:255 length:165 start_codon:yes stop_codon:yes gene_type:complete
MKNNCAAVKLRVWLDIVFYDGAVVSIRFEIEIDAVNWWRVLDWVCLGGLLIRNG